MKLALVGYGKMGRAVENVAMERGHEVVARIDPTLDTKEIGAETLGGAQVHLSVVAMNSAPIAGDSSTSPTRMRMRSSSSTVSGFLAAWSPS